LVSIIKHAIHGGERRVPCFHDNAFQIQAFIKSDGPYEVEATPERNPDQFVATIKGLLPKGL